MYFILNSIFQLLDNPPSLNHPPRWGRQSIRSAIVCLETLNSQKVQVHQTKCCLCQVWSTQTQPPLFLEYGLIVCFHLLRGRLAVAVVLSRAQLPGVGLRRPLPPGAVANATQEVLNGRPHFLVLVGVDAGVHDGVENRQEEQPAFWL